MTEATGFELQLSPKDDDQSLPIVYESVWSVGKPSESVIRVENDESAITPSEADFAQSIFDKKLNSTETLSRKDNSANVTNLVSSYRGMIGVARPSARTIMKGSLLQSAKKPGQSLLGRYNRNISQNKSQVAAQR
eukprot:CAMPEP_0185589222 /NCGR_PEP_ID=MMETSP0434-20130131/56080_1 /TAXON_ID=626734 ORGANISM="Favella taraikaensis, Strain Fe Narragansett Bay" /NCGR_SAMPLE_ID=MMETSP0434 /ASSEMBLY_ACC=CAM_ASM_000379 /LENGTH=134 /DNA_ID=CAMNT_0028212433 /DNA_START=733 /DNA_END=1137 /DNA_ORIENTATION=-